VAANNWVPGFGAKATVVVTIDWQDLKDATAHAIGDTVHGTGLSAAATRLLACDAKIIPVVLGSNSEPLDVGRCERLVTKGMRRALNTRDRGCVVCGAPPVQCDAHHLVSWIDGGTTAVSNLVLLCRVHHVDLHAGKWFITITDGKVHVERPAWAVPRSLRYRTPSRPPREPSFTAASNMAQSQQEPSGCDEGAVLTAVDVRAVTMRAVGVEDPRPEPPERITPLPDDDDVAVRRESVNSPQPPVPPAADCGRPR